MILEEWQLSNEKLTTQVEQYLKNNEFPTIEEKKYLVQSGNNHIENILSITIQLPYDK